MRRGNRAFLLRVFETLGPSRVRRGPQAARHGWDDCFLGPGAGMAECLNEGDSMIDLIYVLVTVVFFGLMIVYVQGCELLGGDAEGEEKRP